MSRVGNYALSVSHALPQRESIYQPEAILELLEDHRLVFMLRDVEGMSTDETAESLDIGPENVKIRLHRARAGLRKELYARAGASTAEAFQFHASCCDRVVKKIFKALELPG